MNESSVIAGRPHPLYEQLRPRSNGPGRETVARSQRQRMIGAMIEEAGEHGYEGATLARLVGLAGVSKRAFHEQFGTKQAYFLATYDAVVEQALDRIGLDHGPGEGSEKHLHRTFDALVREVTDEPKAAKLALVAALGAGPAALARMQRTRTRFEQTIAASFSDRSGGVTLPPFVLEGIVRGVERVVRQRLLAGRVQELPALASELVAWVHSYGSVGAAQFDEALPLRESTLHVRGRPAWSPSERIRILQATAYLAAKNGYAGLTSAQIARAAGVSEERLEVLYGDREASFLAALNLLGLEALKAARDASRPSAHPPDDVYQGILALMQHLASDQVLQRVAFVEVFVVGPAAVEQRESLLRKFNELLLRRIPEQQRPSDAVIEAIGGAIWGIVHHHITHRAAKRLPALAGQLSYLALAPVIGGDAALRAIQATVVSITKTNYSCKR